MASPIKVEGVQLPGDTMDPDAIESAAKSLSSTGTAVSNRGSAVLTSWQGLASSYQAPEQETLFTSMNPAKTAAESFGTDMGTTAGALNTFASEVRTIKAEVAKIKSDALAFLGTIKDGKISVHHPAMMAGRASMPAHDENVDWDSDQGSVDKNNALIHRMNDQQEKLWTAERTCANALNAICGATPISAADPNAQHPTGYGYTDLPDNAEMPWGHSVQRKEGCGESLVKGFFVDGLWNGMVQGLTSLVGFSWTGPGGAGFSWSTLGHAWEGVAKLGTALSPTNSLMMLMPGPLGDWSRSSEKTLTQTVTGMVGIDPYAKDPFAAWKSNPWRTGGSSAFNILSFLVPESKAGDAGKAGEAGDAARAAGLAGKAGRVLDVVGDGAKWLKGVTLDGLTKVTSKLGFDKVFHFGDDVKIPEVGRVDTKVDTTNLGHGGHGGHADAPPARTPVDDGAGSHPGSGHDGQPVGPGHGTGDHGTGDHGTGDHGTGDHGTGDHPTPGTGDGTKESPRVYEYHNQAENLRGEHQPTAAEVHDIGPVKDYQPGTHDHMVARWHDYQARGGTQSWDTWRDGYIRNQGQHARGVAYEQAFWDTRHFSSDEWARNTSVQDATGVNRNYDMVNTAEQSAYELKSGDTIDPGQLVKDHQLVDAGWDVHYVFGKEPSASVIEKLRQAGVTFEVFHGEPVVVK